MDTPVRHPMQRLTPGEMPGPGAQALVPITAAMRSVFTSCPHTPAMAGPLAGIKAEAEQLGGDQVVHHCGFSPFTGADLRLGLSYGNDPDLATVLGTGRRWHLSVSEGIGGRRDPAELPELLTWVMTGWPAATKFVAYTILDGHALHANIPAHTRASRYPLRRGQSRSTDSGRPSASTTTMTPT